jgi:hypothetical protein
MRREQIRAVLLRLPILESKRFALEACVFQLEFCADQFTRLDHPNSRTSGTAAAQDHLERFWKLVSRLAQNVNAMPREAIEALEREIRSDEERRIRLAHPEFRDSPLAWYWSLLLPSELQQQLVRYQSCARRAHEELARDPQPNRIGAHQKKRAQAITRLAAWIYEHLTGKDTKVATDAHSFKAYGPFLEFLTELFVVLGINASAESQARAYLMEKRATEAVP